MGTIRRIYRLSSTVLAVAVADGREWTAYIDAVPGICHEKEAESVARNGTKMPQALAKVLFPEMANSYPWRD